MDITDSKLYRDMLERKNSEHLYGSTEGPVTQIVLERFRRKLIDDPEWAKGWMKNPLND